MEWALKSIKRERWLYEQIEMAGITCLIHDGVTWESFVERNPSCYIGYYDSSTDLGIEIQDKLRELLRTGKSCAYFDVEQPVSHCC